MGVLQIGPEGARHVLVLNPGTSASAAYFAPLAKTVVERAKGWQVWAVERRENLLEDHSVLDRAKAGMASGQELFDYYLGWLTNPAITTHFQFIADADVAFAREWGMRVEIEDLRRVVTAAKKGPQVVVGGHSLGARSHRLPPMGLRRRGRAKGLAGSCSRRRQQSDTLHAGVRRPPRCRRYRPPHAWLTFGASGSVRGPFNAPALRAR